METRRGVATPGRAALRPLKADAVRRTDLSTHVLISVHMKLPWAIADVLSNRAAVQVLRVLVMAPFREFSGREVAREAKVGASNALRELRRLEAQGLVVSRGAGGATLWRAWKEHVLFEALQRLYVTEANVDESLLQRVIKGLHDAPGLREIWLYGSRARGDERADSDVDVLVVVNRESQKEQALDAALGVSGDLRRSYRVPLSPIVYSEKEYRAKRGLPLLRNIRKEGRLLWRATN